jgi:hypothetical protein
MSQTTRLMSDELVRLLQLAEQADSIELKLTMPERNYRSAAAALGLDPLDAQIRQVYFFDTPELALEEAGVVVRARRIQGRDADTVVKLRPVEPQQMPAELRASPSFGIEVDAMPGGFVCSASMKAKVSDSSVRRTLAGKQPQRKLFSKEQRGFFAAHAPSGLTIDGLAVLGPILVLKLKVSPDTFSRRVVIEMWLYPDGSRVAEVSTKCTPSEALTVAAEARAFLESKGIDTEGEQQTKTKAALQFFSAELRTASSSPA